MIKRFFLGMFFLLFSGIFFSTGVRAAQELKYGIGKFDSVAKLFSWGMSKDDVAKAINGTLVETRPGVYSMQSSWDAIPAKYTFIINNNDLSGIIIEFSTNVEGVDQLVGQLKNAYGSPTGESYAPNAYQWADDFSDAAIVVKDITFPGRSVVLAFRKIAKSDVNQVYGPGRISVFNGLYLGMSRDAMEQKFVFATLSDAGNGRLVANINLDLCSAKASFIFQQDVLVLVVVEVPLSTDDLSAKGQWFDRHKTFLSHFYGTPTDETEGYAVWADASIEAGFAWSEEMRSFVLRYRLLETQ